MKKSITTTALPHGSSDKVDEFGFPVISLLGVAAETAEQRAARIKAVRRIALRAFHSIIDQLGHQRALELFKKAAASSRLPSGPKKKMPINYELERIYRLEAKYCKSPDELKSLPRRIAAKLAEDCPGTYGPTAEAIAKQLRRLKVLKVIHVDKSLD